jgi:antitoxin component HigA of HigAB toxin-antitoxin module
MRQNVFERSLAQARDRQATLHGVIFDILRRETLNMIRRLHAGIGIPAESLIKVGPHRAA